MLGLFTEKMSDEDPFSETLLLLNICMSVCLYIETYYSIQRLLINTKPTNYNLKQLIIYTTDNREVRRMK